MIPYNWGVVKRVNCETKTKQTHSCPKAFLIFTPRITESLSLHRKNGISPTYLCEKWWCTILKVNTSV